jgi:hypothetical protein
MKKSNKWNDDIINEFIDAGDDFGFSAVDKDELENLSKKSNDDIDSIRQKLDLILEMNSTCEGAMQVKEQYEELLNARMKDIEKQIVPLLLNLKKNGDKDYIYWPGKQRETQCDLQIQKLLNLTRNNL